jgi:mannosyltransferase
MGNPCSAHHDPGLVYDLLAMPDQLNAVTPVVVDPAPAAPPRDSGSRLPGGSTDLVFWLVPALVAGALGIWRLTGAALWADELATWGAARLSWDQLWQLWGAVDAVLAPYYAAMKVYVAVAGTGTVAMRLPTVLATIAATVVVSALGNRFGGRWAALTAGLMFAVLPVTSRYAQEIRPYAPAMFAAALSLLCLLRLLERPTAGRVAGYCGALLLASLSHPLSGLLVLAGHGVAVLLRRQWRLARPWLIAAVPGGLPALFLVALGYRNRAQISWIKVLTWETFQVFPERLFLAGAVAGIVLGLALVAVRRDTTTLAAAGFVPVAGLLLAGVFAPVWTPRYVLVALPALAVLAALAALRFGRAPAAAVLAVTALLGFPAQLDVREPAGHSEDSAKIAAVIRPLYRAGDVAVFPDNHVSIPWAPRDIYERYLPAPGPPDVLRVKPQRADGKFLATECPQAACLGTPPRIWVIRVDNRPDPFTDMGPAKQKLLRDNYRQVRRWNYPLLGIILLERNPGAR